MDELMKTLHTYSRLLLLEESLSGWENQAAEEKLRIQKLQENLAGNQAELAKADTRSFLQNIFVKTKDRRKMLTRQEKELSEDLAAALAAEASLEQKIRQAREELTGLPESRAAYTKAKEEISLTVSQENQMMMEQIAAFGPLALTLAQRTLQSLEQLLLLGSGVAVIRQTLLQEAAENAGSLGKILQILPEGFAEMCTCLPGGDGFFPDKVLGDEEDRFVHQAAAQLQNLINQLRAILGE